MRHPVLTVLLVLGIAGPANAQERRPVEQRVGKLEQEMQAVQRRVFKPGEPRTASEPAPVAAPDSNALVDVNARLDALEAQLRTLTGQVEEQGFRLRTLEEEGRRTRAELDARLRDLEPSPTQPAPNEPAPAPAPDPQPDEGPGAATLDSAAFAPLPADPGEAAYVTGYRLWEAKRYDEAIEMLSAMVKAYPRHAKVSWANNLIGRAHLDSGRPATAAEVLLGNYQTNPKGDRAADSLYYLGEAMMALKKAPQACKVYDELEEVYGGSMRRELRARVPNARRDARCQG